MGIEKPHQNCIYFGGFNLISIAMQIYYEFDTTGTREIKD